MNAQFKVLLTSMDVLNTINGGTAEPSLLFTERPAAREIRIRVPGVSKDALNIEVNNNNLSVFCFLPISSSGKLIQIPRVVYNQPIPYFIEVSRIKATFEENELVVELPFNELSNGYSRKIKIV